ncbi:MAG: hypothetical protein HKM04_11910 [Legionellales bacterium]|nr:hypothetical protein [Legionellales bacterium]
MKKQSNYVSEIDQLLAELRSTVEESPQQVKERVKAKEIARKRDNPQVKEKIEIWEEF